MAKIYKIIVYVEDYEETGSMGWQVDLEQTVLYDPIEASADAYACGETRSYDPLNEDLEGMSLQEIFEEFYE